MEESAVARPTINKWDMMDEERQYYLQREIDRQLYNARWGAAGEHLRDRRAAHGPAGTWRWKTALAGWETRVPAGRLNSWLTALVAGNPPPVRGGRQPKILFATRAGIRPPHVVLFTTGFLEATPRRLVERKLREEFGFEGSPLKVSMRLREKRSRGSSSRGQERQPPMTVLARGSVIARPNG